MKKTTKVLIAALLLLTVWLGAVISANILTMLHGGSFQNLEAVGFDCLHPWEGEPGLRVLSYTRNRAKVYYFASTGGEKVLFTKDEGKWAYRQTLHSWSDFGGTADDYFIWPYFKNWVL